MNKIDRYKILIRYAIQGGVVINQKDFGQKLGYTNESSFSQIINGKVNEPKDFINKVGGLIPDLNLDWLLTGDGEMLHATDVAADGDGSSIGSDKTIRYWTDVEATAGGVQLFDDMTTNKFISLSIPEFRDCTDAVNLYGDSMLPIYKSGQIIILKEWNESFIDFGNVYLVITKSGNRMVKYLRKGSDVTHVMCVSENRDFDPFEIDKSDILRLYLVKGGISKNTL